MKCTCGAALPGSSSKPRAFSQDYGQRVLNLVTTATVYPLVTYNADRQGKPHEVMAIWDTGATTSLIAPKLAAELELVETDKSTIEGIGGSVAVVGILLTVELPNKVRLENHRFWVSNFAAPNCDLLIGMDIITLGDLALSNAAGTTLLTFAIPPYPEKIDFLKK